MQNLKINPLPSKTWNWLHMNESELTEVTVAASNAVKTECPAKISRSLADTMPLETIGTGMGSDMDRLAAEAGVIPNVYTIAAGEKEQSPLRLHFDYAEGEKALNVIGLNAAENSEMTVIMDYTAPQKSGGLAAIQTKLFVANHARIRLIQIERLGEEFICLNDIGGVCADGARLEVIHLVLGGKNVYQGCQVDLAGDESSFKADIGYRLQGTDKLDMNYVALHYGKKSESEINVSGVLRDQAFKLFRGTIDFKTGSSASVGGEKEDVLLMDDTVVNQTIPLILCGEEDVQGNHGATIGRLGEDLIFYLASRGISHEEIYEMMARARIDAVCRKIPDETTQSEIQQYLEDGDGNEDEHG